jgi:putative ATP-binding cassette transporter
LNGEVLNPDQRIAEDVKVFTTTTLSFLLMALNGAFTVIAFAGVMWTISPVLFGVAVAYAVFGSIMTIVLGRPLVLLNYSQLDKEATFRSDLVHIREHAESIAVLRRESRVKGRLLKHFDELASNFEKIIRVNRNLGFFTTGYNYMVQIIPALIVAPMFMRGEIEFGVITQSGMAFVHLLGAFSLIVTQFQSISSFAAVIARLGALVEGMADAQKPNPDSIQIETAENLAYENLTLNSTAASQRLIEDLTLEIPVGTRLQVLGPNESANADLFRATAGISEPGSGTIHRPGLDQIMFLPERPYLPPGTLRELLLRTGHEHKIDEQQIKETLTALQLERLIERSEGLDVEQNWDNLLSLGEQQLVAAARVLMAAPRYAVLDRLNSALTPSQVHRLLGLLKQRGITYLHFGEVDDALRHFDAVLELSGTGPWNCKPLTGDTGAGTPHPTGR